LAEFGKESIVINKDTISAIVDRFNWDTPEIKKSVVNRLASALDKSGSATSRIGMVLASINSLAGNYELDPESDDYTSLDLIMLFLGYTQQVARDSQTATATNPAPVSTTTGAIKKSKKRKSGWENLKDVEPAKPAKSQSPEITFNAEVLEAIMKAIASK
jgi:hypothetical protein